VSTVVVHNKALQYRTILLIFSLIITAQMLSVEWEALGYISDLSYVVLRFIKCTCLPATTEEVNANARYVCLSVCLLARLLKNVCMDFDDILRVDRR